MLLLGAGGYVATLDRGATHAGLKASDLPPLIPTRTFFANPNLDSNHVASPDGKFVVFERATITGRSFLVREVGGTETFGELPLGLSALRWHPSKPLLRFIFEGQDWEVDPVAPERKNWKRTSPVRLSGGWAKNRIATDDEMTILTWGRTSPSATPAMWLVSQDGQSAEQVADGTDKTRYWVFDADIAPVLRLDSLDPATERLMRKTEDGWRNLIDISLNDVFWPLSAVRSDGTLLVRSARGRDKAAMVSFDVDTGEETVLIENPDADIGWTIALTHQGEPDVIQMGANTHERKALTERGQAFLDVLAQFAQPVSLGATVPTASGRYVTQALSVQSQSYVFLLIDLEEKSYVTLSEHPLRGYGDDLVLEKAVTYTARDGLEIPAVMTLPKGVEGPVPFIVYVHGGPALHIEVGYGHFTQMLVNRGYGVLAVNYRGSTGFGKAFQSKGFKEFGRAMQDDITDAANWLVAQGLADTDALVVMGESYGGYAAAMAMTRDPGLFDAAIVEFPMLDAEFQTRHYPGFWENGLNVWWRYFGRIENDDDLAMMREYSPINRVAEIHGPIMVLGGVKDQITAIQQVRDFEKAAEAADAPVVTHYFEEAGHGMSSWRDHLRRARLIEEFLAEQVGGRSGGFEFAERAPAFID